MDKQSLKKTVLLVVVIVIWGIVGYRIYQKFQPNNKPVATQFTQVMVYEKEEFDLKLDYKDPFLSAQPKRISNNNSRKSASNSAKISKNNKPEKIKWPSIQYYGYAKKEGDIVYLAISVNGENQIIPSNQKIDNIFIQSFNEDSIRMQFKSDYKVFKVK